MDHDVVVVGAGPVGLMLAAELRLAGVRVVVLEQLSERSAVPKANGLVGQVVPLLHRRGLYEVITGKARAPQPTPAYMFGGLPLLLGQRPDNPLFTVAVPQWDLEGVLQRRAEELGASIRRGRRVAGFVQDEHGVDVTVTGGDSVRAAFLVGCDGAHSVVRTSVGIGFPGVTTDRVTSRTAHVTLPVSMLRRGGELVLPDGSSLRPFTYHRTDRGVFSFAAFQPGVQLVTALEWDQPPVGDDEPVSIEEIRAAVARVLGVDVPFTAPTTPGRHTLRRVSARNSRLADRYRVGRVLVAGDAAHVHAAVGGPGLNLGLQDVVNLAWKLAGTIHGWAPAGLLDTYESERRPAAERVVMHTQAQAALLAPGGEVTALRALFGELLANPVNAGRVADMLAGPDVRYGSGEGPVGRWVADFPLRVAGRSTSLAELARSGRPLLLDLDGDPALAEVAAGWADRVDLVVGHAEHPPASALLVRPDGYAAWATGAGSVAEALRAWFGAPRTAAVSGVAGGLRRRGRWGRVVARRR